MSQVKKLTLSQIDEGRKKALINAENLIRDAGLLLNNNSWARAFFLSQLSLEEMGKYILLISAASNPQLQNMDWNHFWKFFEFHKSKDRNEGFLKFIFTEAKNLKEQMKYIRELYGDDVHDSLRRASLISDFIKNNFYGPMDTINEELATFWVSIAERYLNSFKYFDENVIDFKGLSKLKSTK